MDWIEERPKKYGNIEYVALTDNGRIALYEEGVMAAGVYSSVLWEALRKANFDIRVVKMAGNSWFFATRKGGWQYSM